jgi:hypothetical protein
VTGEFLMPHILREYLTLFYKAKTSYDPQNCNPHNSLFSHYIQILDLSQTFKSKMEQFYSIVTTLSITEFKFHLQLLDPT